MLVNLLTCIAGTFDRYCGDNGEVKEDEVTMFTKCCIIIITAHKYTLSGHHRTEITTVVMTIKSGCGQESCCIMPVGVL